MEEVEVIRADDTKVRIDLSKCTPKVINGQDHYQHPDGWWFYKQDEGIIYERKIIDMGYEFATVTTGTPRFSYRESESTVQPADVMREKPRPSVPHVGTAVRKAIIEWFENQPKGRKFTKQAIADGIGRTPKTIQNQLPRLVGNFKLLANDRRAGLWWRTDRPVPPGFTGEFTSDFSGEAD